MSIKLIQADEINRLCQPRPGEQKIAQTCLIAQSQQSQRALEHAKQQGARFALIGIPEDIGPRANLGTAGADLAWQAFLTRFVNLQDNQYLAGNSIVIAGQVDCDDLQLASKDLDTNNAEQLAKLRDLCQQLDTRVEAAINQILKAQLFPIIIGGGHNNALPILSAVSQNHDEGVAAVNLDPHSDFRPPEGRHSGNGFSYAYQQDILKHYAVVGLHEHKNSAKNLELFQQAGFVSASYQSIFVRQEQTYQQALNKVTDYLCQTNLPLGIEVDMDSINLMPVSAYTNCGLSQQQAEQYVYRMASLPQANYLHLAEAAPARHPVGLNQGLTDAGQALSALVCAFIQAKA